MKWAAIVRLLIETFAPVVAEAITQMLRNLNHAGADDALLHRYVRETVDDIAGRYSAATPEEKRCAAAHAIKEYAKRNGRDLSDSLVNTLIEMHVQARKGESL